MISGLWLKSWIPREWISASFRTLKPATVIILIALAGCGKDKTGSEVAPVPKVVTADIQAGIEKYIDEQTRLNQGYYRLPFRDKDLRLKLVRVHTEYLANLGPRHHFACVDLAGIDSESVKLNVQFSFKR